MEPEEHVLPLMVELVIINDRPSGSISRRLRRKEQCLVCCDQSWNCY